MIDSLSFSCDLHSMPNCTRLAFLFTILSRVVFFFFILIAHFPSGYLTLLLLCKTLELMCWRPVLITIQFDFVALLLLLLLFIFCLHETGIVVVIVHIHVVLWYIQKRAQQQAHAEYIWCVFICKRVNLHQNWLLCFTNSHRKCEQRKKLHANLFIPNWIIIMAHKHNVQPSPVQSNVQRWIDAILNWIYSKNLCVRIFIRFFCGTATVFPLKCKID